MGHWTGDLPLDGTRDAIMYCTHRVSNYLMGNLASFPVAFSLKKLADGPNGTGLLLLSAWFIATPVLMFLSFTYGRKLVSFLFYNFQLPVPCFLDCGPILAGMVAFTASSLADL
jgi:hypothetical protein